MALSMESNHKWCRTIRSWKTQRSALPQGWAGAGLFARPAVCQTSTLILKLAKKREAVQRGSISPSVTQTWSAHCPRAQRPLCHVVASHGKVQNVAVNLWLITWKSTSIPRKREEQFKRLQQENLGSSMTRRPEVTRESVLALSSWEGSGSADGSRLGRVENHCRPAVCVPEKFPPRWLRGLGESLYVKHTHTSTQYMLS